MEEKSYAPRRPGLTAYLGPEDLRTRRLAAISELAADMGISVSKMLQWIGDGRLLVTRNPKYKKPEDKE